MCARISGRYCSTILAISSEVIEPDGIGTGAQAVTQSRLAAKMSMMIFFIGTFNASVFLCQ
jgi:hypothetical protein